MDDQFIYLDNNATTPVDPRVVDAMLPYFYEKPGNAASNAHLYGWIAKDAVDYSREQIASLIASSAKEITFTSGATESINLAIKGVFEGYQSKGNHIITVNTEHKAVLDTCKALEKRGAIVTYLPVDKSGMINIQDLKNAIRKETILVSIMWANNETGVIQDMARIGKICQEYGVILFSDSTQAVGKMETHPASVGIHLMAFSAHKMYGTKGCGALYVSSQTPKIKLHAQMDGGGHEKGLRAGTMNVPAIVAFGKAAEIAKQEMNIEEVRLAKLRNIIEESLKSSLDIAINAQDSPRLAHTSNISFNGVKADDLLMKINRLLAISTGSACTSASTEPSHVLKAMGISEEKAYGSIRISIGRFNKEADVFKAIELIKKAVLELKRT